MIMKIFEELSEEEKQKIDNLILLKKTTEGTKVLLKLLDISLKDMLKLYSVRYNELKIICPEKFLEQNDEAYWGTLYAYWIKPIIAFEDLEEVDKQEIDKLIFQGRILYGLKAIKAKTNRSLKDAIDLYHQHYEALRNTQLERFEEKDAQKYWEGFYS